MAAYILLVLTTLVVQAGVVGRAPSTPDIGAADSLVAAWVEREAVAGAVLVVARGGDVVHEAAYGWASLYGYGDGQYGGGVPLRLADPVAMSTETAFDLASVTKVMATTFAVMLLVDDGALELDAPVLRYLPDFTGGGKDAITLRHLLTHRAGLAQWKPVYYHADEPDEAYRYIRDLPLGWPVGEGRHYSDLGFMLLGRVVETVTGRSLDAFLQEHLYGPLGLRRTGFRPADATSAGPAGPFASTSHGNPFERRMVYDSTFGYSIEGDADAWDDWRRYTLTGEVNDGNAFHAFAGVAGHAGLFSTAGELRVLLRLLLDGGVADGVRYIGADVVTEFLAEGSDGQALGWQVPDYAPEGAFAHTGFTGTWVMGVPTQDLTVVLLTNRQNVGVGSDTRYTDVAPLQRAVAQALTGGAAGS